MAKAKPWFWLVRTDQPHITAGAMMDMLRYDCALVHSNAPGGYWLLSSEHKPPTVERWNSFGIHIIGPARDEYTLRERLSL